MWDSARTAVFVIGSALLVFASARNTVTWHLQNFWGASGDFWQTQWEKIWEWFGGDPHTMAIYGTGFATLGTFWFFNSFLLLVEYTRKPSILQKYKIQDDTPVDPKKLRSALYRVVFNQFVVGFPVVYTLYKGMLWRGCSFGRELPSFPWVVWELFVFIWVEEIGFYYSHRLAHHPRLYKHIHKIHHEWTAPIGLISLYAHPIEHVIANLMPPMLGPIICGSHIATAWMWFSLALISTTIAHSGYHFPFLPSPEAHDFHHLKFTNNFGVLGVLDRLHGTDSVFRQTKAYERHIFSLSLVPIREIIPDDLKKKEK
jgi:methylsterol monooxygenase